MRHGRQRGDDHHERWIPLNGWFPFLVPLLFAAFNRKGKHYKRYQIQNAAYWLGANGTFVLLLGRIPGDLFSQTAIPIAMTAIAGAAVIGLRRREPGKRGTENATDRRDGQDVSEAEQSSGMLRLRLHSTVPLGATVS